MGEENKNKNPFNPSKLLIKVFNIRSDYVEAIPGNSSPEKDKANLNSFFEKVKLNRGVIKSLNTVNNIETKGEHYERFDGEAAKQPFSTGYVDDIRAYIESSHHFVIHYKCYKKLEYQKEPINLEDSSMCGKFSS